MDAGPMYPGCSLNTRKREPKIVWQLEERRYQVPQACCEHLQGNTGKQGPISLLRHTFETCGVECPRPDLWSIRGDTGAREP